MKRATIIIASLCILWTASVFSDPAVQQKIIQVKEGVRFFRDGDSITITEVKVTLSDLKAGGKLIVKGHYALSSMQKASLFLSVTDTKGPGKGEIRPEQKIDISAGQSEFELSTTLEYDGYLHVTFYSIVEGQRPQWRDTRTAVLPVKLEPGHYCRIGISSKSHRNFRSAAGVPARPSAICFTTRGAGGAVTAKTQKPAILEMRPANGAAEVDPQTTELRVTFSVPMGGGFS